MIRKVLLRCFVITTIAVALVGCSDSKARRRVAAMDTETLVRLSKDYPADSMAGRLIAEELSRRPRQPAAAHPTNPEPAAHAQQRTSESEPKSKYQETTRKEIFKAIGLAEDRADSEAQQRHPLEPADHLAVGQSMSLSRQTPLMPELDPADPMAAIQRMRQLPAGSQIRVVAVSDKHAALWYQVHASSPSGLSLGSGWINRTALRGQSPLDLKEQLRKQGELMDMLMKEYKQEIAAKYDLTEKDLIQISVEGISKNWPMP